MERRLPELRVYHEKIARRSADMRKKRMPATGQFATAALIMCALSVLSTGCAAATTDRYELERRNSAYAAFGAAWMQIYDAQKRKT